MIKQCNAAGVDVIADVVLNHTTGHDVSWVDDQYGVDGTAYNGSYGRYPSMDPYAEGGTQGLYQYQESGNSHQYGLPSGDFHTCKSNVSDNISDYSNADEVWNCRLSTMWDINTGNGRVQNMQADYLNRLWQYGVRGFRIDSAKHMDPDDIAAIKRKFMDKAGINGQSFPWSQEVIYHQGESSKFAPERYEKKRRSDPILLCVFAAQGLQRLHHRLEIHHLRFTETLRRRHSVRSELGQRPRLRNAEPHVRRPL